MTRATLKVLRYLLARSLANAFSVNPFLRLSYPGLSLCSNPGLAFVNAFGVCSQRYHSGIFCRRIMMKRSVQEEGDSIATSSTKASRFRKGNDQSLQTRGDNIGPCAFGAGYFTCLGSRR